MAAGDVGFAAGLSRPPVDIDTDPLVVGTLDISTAQLKSILNWLARCVQDHQRELAGLGARLNTLDGGRPTTAQTIAGGASPDGVAALEAAAALGSVTSDNALSPGSVPRTLTGIPADNGLSRTGSQTLRDSMREELTAMQISSIKHELAALQKPGDLLEQQRGVAQAEAAAISEALKERIRETDERLKNDLAAATRELHEQLLRISSEVVNKFEILEAERGLGAATASGSLANREAPLGANPDAAVARDLGRNASDAFGDSHARVPADGEAGTSEADREIERLRAQVASLQQEADVPKELTQVALGELDTVSSLADAVRREAEARAQLGRAIDFLRLEVRQALKDQGAAPAGGDAAPWAGRPQGNLRSNSNLGSGDFGLGAIGEDEEDEEENEENEDGELPADGPPSADGEPLQRKPSRLAAPTTRDTRPPSHHAGTQTTPEAAAGTQTSAQGAQVTETTAPTDVSAGGNFSLTVPGDDTQKNESNLKVRRSPRPSDSDGGGSSRVQASPRPGGEGAESDRWFIESVNKTLQKLVARLDALESKVAVLRQNSNLRDKRADAAKGSNESKRSDAPAGTMPQAADEQDRGLDSAGPPGAAAQSDEDVQDDPFARVTAYVEKLSDTQGDLMDEFGRDDAEGDDASIDGEEATELPPVIQVKQALASSLRDQPARTADEQGDDEDSPEVVVPGVPAVSATSGTNGGDNGGKVVTDGGGGSDVAGDIVGATASGRSGDKELRLGSGGNGTAGRGSLLDSLNRRGGGQTVSRNRGGSGADKALERRVVALEDALDQLQNSVAFPAGQPEKTVKDVRVLATDAHPHEEESTATKSGVAGPIAQLINGAGGTTTPLMPDGPQWNDVQAELERFRKLFEFVQSVLPKDLADAMSFFSKAADERASSGEDPAVKTLGPGVDLERHRSKLEDEVRRQCKDLRHEFDNLTRAIGGLQRELETTSTRTSDLASHIARVESAQQSSPTPPASAGPVDNTPAPGDLSHLLDPASGDAGEGLPFVSKRKLESALDGLKDDIRNWLDMLHNSMLNALSHKADSDQLTEVATRVTQAAHVASDSMAAFAKRALLGRCASCDAHISAHPSKVKMPVPVAGLQGSWPPTSSTGANVNIRPPESRPLMAMAPKSPPTGSGNRLPRISQDMRAHRDFPKGKILKNSSTPELRAIKHQDDP